MKNNNECKCCKKNPAWKHGYCPMCVGDNEYIGREVERLDKQEAQLQAAVQAFSNLVNDMSMKPDVLGEFIAQAMVREHRTLQQSMISVLVAALRRYAAISNSDARNEAAVKWAKKATSDDDYFPFV